MTVVERYLAALPAHDWDALAACLAPDVHRIGPYGDEYRGREAYVRFLAELLPTLPGYHMEVARVVEGAGGRSAFVELAETVDVDGAPVRTPEGLVFDLDDDGRIARIAVYLGRDT